MHARAIIYSVVVEPAPRPLSLVGAPDDQLERLLVALEEIEVELDESEADALIDDIAGWYHAQIATVFASPRERSLVDREAGLEDLLEASLRRAREGVPGDGGR